MSDLHCMYDDVCYDFFVKPDPNLCKLIKSCKCHSCGKQLQVGDTVRYVRVFQENYECEKIGAREIYYCEDCDEIMKRLDGYISYGSDVSAQSLLKIYQNMVGFNPCKYVKVV